MSTQEREPSVSRLVRLQGGLIAIHNSGSTEAAITSGIGAPILCSVKIPAYAALVRTLEKQGFRVLGVEFYQTSEQITGVQPPDWRAFCPGVGWLVHDVSANWAERSTGAYEKGDREFGELAARIAFGLRAAEERLRQAALAYSIQLRSLHLRDALRRFVVFEDVNGLAVILAIHAMFYDLGTARDALAEFFARYVFRAQLPRRKRSWDMSTLADVLRSTPESDEPYWREQLLSATDKKSDPPGWLAELARYRNRFMHSAPVHFARNVRGGIQEMQEFGELGSLPVVYHPLPAHPRDEGSTINPLTEGAAPNPRRRPIRSVEPDSIEYMSTSLLLLASISFAAAGRAPYERLVRTLTDEDLIGEVRIHRR